MAMNPAAEADPNDRAAYHAQEAERLLEGKLGLLNNRVDAQVHATLAVYYAIRQTADT